MKNKVRPIDAKAAGLKVSEYMREHANTPGKYVACMGIIGILGREEETPTLAGFVPDYSGGPLTLEQLRKMDGRPAFGVSLINEKPGEWFIIRIVEISKNWFIACAGASQGFGDKDTYGESWLAYPYPPARIDREPCQFCSGKTELYQSTRTTKLFMGKFGKHHIITTESVRCPPYADCCCKNQPIRASFAINFCPACGRPLTPEACEMLEARFTNECPISESLESCEDCGFCELEDTMSEWISVKDALPELREDGTLDCFLVSDGFLVHMAYYADRGWIFCESGEMKEPMFYDVVYWMPLPEPPKEG